MNPVTLFEAKKIFTGIIKNLPRIKNTGVVVCPPDLYLSELSKIRTTKIKLGGQNAFYEEKGAYTGEIGAEMLSQAGAKYVILGHSECRARGETNEIIAKKIPSALEAGLIPILCIGESFRENGEYLSFLKEEIRVSLSLVPKAALSKIIIAYEPIWAIGKKALREATPAESLEMAIFIRRILFDLSGGLHKKTVILYGGSVTAKNAFDFLSHGGVEGLLVGRESLDPKNFSKVISLAETL